MRHGHGQLNTARELAPHSAASWGRFTPGNEFIRRRDPNSRPDQTIRVEAGIFGLTPGRG